MDVTIIIATDMDMDGYPASMDCDDGDPAINPGAAEICGNDVDEDCSGLANPCPMPPADKDMDGSPEDSDCDDNDPDRFPSNPEVPCDGVDQDCSGVDECDTPDAGPSDATPGRPDAPRGAPDARAPGAADAATGSTRADASAPVTPTDSSSCGCRHTPRRGPDRPSLGILGLGILLVALRPKRRR